MIEIVHSKLIKKLPPFCASRLSFTLTECQCFHTVIQIFKSVNNYFPSYLLNVFWYSKDVAGYCGCNINHLFVPELPLTLVKEVSFIVEQVYGTV